MIRLLPGVLGLVAIGVWIYCILDVIRTEPAFVRNLPKVAWLLVVVFFSIVGAIAWLAFGRPLFAGPAPGSPPAGPPPKVQGPDDSPDFLRDLDERLRRRDDDDRSP